jgi:predicted ATPase
MLESVQFRNFKVLRDTTLPLSRFTLLVGPNGSGKSTALQALQAAADPSRSPFNRFSRVATAGLPPTETVEVILQWGSPYERAVMPVRWERSNAPERVTTALPRVLSEKLSRVSVYALDANAIASPRRLQPTAKLQSNGADLVIVLDRLRDRAPERFEALNAELGRWLPEFDRILFDTPSEGTRAFLLRTREGHHPIPAADLSQGTLLALAILTLAYVPDPPPIVGFEEPDRGIHPRLLREVRDALYRLSYPEHFGESRHPVQVIATTHSPYFLDLFRDHPEEIVIAQKVGQEARFERLSDRSDIDEILGEASLGEVWYSGILGGVPAES